MDWTTVPSRDAPLAAKRAGSIIPPDDLRFVQSRLTIPAVVIVLLALSPLPLVLPSGLAIAMIAALGSIGLIARRRISPPA
jgi:hypothetical protein